MRRNLMYADDIISDVDVHHAELNFDYVKLYSTKLNTIWPFSRLCAFCVELLLL